MKLTRRKFLALGLSTGLVAAYSVYKLQWGDGTDVIVAILQRRVGYLRVDPGTFQTFAAEYMDYRKSHRRNLVRLSLLSLPLRLFTPYAWVKQGHALRRLEDNVVSLYLLSTDFFHHGADEGREVSYVAYYDPAKTPCRNPFAGQP